MPDGFQLQVDQFFLNQSLIESVPFANIRPLGYGMCRHAEVLAAWCEI